MTVLRGQLALDLDPAIVWCAHEWCDQEASQYVRSSTGRLWWPYCAGHLPDVRTHLAVQAVSAAPARPTNRRKVRGS